MTGDKTGHDVESIQDIGGDMDERTRLITDLQRHKKKADLAWEDLAYKIGVRAKTLWRLINRPETKMHPATLKVIADYLATVKRNGHGR